MRDLVPDDFLPDPDSLRDHRDADAPSERIPDELVDAFFDGDLDEPASREFMKDLREDPATARDVVSMNTALEALRRPVPSPDFTSSIMDTVHGRTPWLSVRQFPMVAQWRAAAAVLFLGLMCAAFFVQRVAPDRTSFTPVSAPITGVADTFPGSSAAIAETFTVSWSTAQQFMSAPTKPRTATHCSSDDLPRCFNSLTAQLFASPESQASSASTGGCKELPATDCVEGCVTVRVKPETQGGTIRVVRTLQVGDRDTLIIK